MTVSVDEVIKVVRNGDGSNTTFTFPFTIYESTDLTIVHVDADGIETTLSEGVGANDYILNVASYPGSGSITYPATGGGRLAADEKLVLVSVLPLEQQLKLNNQGGYFPELQEVAFDKIVRILKQNKEEIDRSVKVSIGSTVDPDALIASLQSDAVNAAASATAAQNAQTAAEGAQTSAEAAQAAAEAAAAQTELPTPVADTMLVRNAGNTAYVASAASAVRSFLSLVVGTDVQAQNAVLQSLAGLGITAGDLVYGSAGNTLSRLAKGTDGQVLQLAGGLPSWGSAGGGVVGPEIFDSVSGTSYDFTVPSTARVIFILFGAASLSGTDHFILRPVTTMGVITSGYSSTSALHVSNASHAAAVTSVTGFVVPIGSGAAGAHGMAVLSMLDDNPLAWTCHTNGGYTGTTTWNGGGSVQVDDPLTNIRVLASGADTFDNGRVTCLYING